MLVTRSRFLSFSCTSVWFVQDTTKWIGKLKSSCAELFTVSSIIGMLTHSRWWCLQKCEHSKHDCTLLSLGVSWSTILLLDLPKQKFLNGIKMWLMAACVQFHSVWLSWTTIVVHNRDRHIIILLFILFIFDTPTAKLVDI